jgi:hypothetical protein
VRAEVGPGPIAWLEDQVFGARDVVKRAAYALLSSQDATLGDNLDVVAAVPALDCAAQGDGSDHWPPSRIPSLWQNPEPGEGDWRPVRDAFLRTIAPNTSREIPAYFYETYIRPDPKRPYSKLLFIAMDTRQLELGMEAGYEDPKPLTGPPGAGHLPRDQSTLDRVVATFNGAFKTEHGVYGMMVNGRVLVPPVPGAATVVVDREQRIGMGNWPQTTLIPDHLISFRQNLDPLVEDGVANPSGRYVWGWQISGTSVMTQRSALCVTLAGHLYYAWGAELDAPTLSHALRQAGCSYAMHLDMNPGHCGFVYTDVVDAKAKRFLPGTRWAPDPGAQPTPAFMPAVWQGSAWVGSLEVRLRSFDGDRIRWRVRSGTREPTLPDAPPKVLELEPADRHSVLAAVGMGHTTTAVGAGLGFGVTPSLVLNPELATVVVGGNSRMRIVPPGEPAALAAGDEAVQLPLLVDGGRVLEAALAPGDMRIRSALCVTDTGRVVIATAPHDSSAPVATALVRVGCGRVVELDRGSRHPAFVHRSGTPTPPLGTYETSVLYALGRPLLPRGFRYKPAGSLPSTKPTLHDVPRAKALGKPKPVPQ